MLQRDQLTPKKLALAIGLLTTQSFAQAQDGGPPGGNDLKLEEIIVTAQKRSESLQDVPLSVSALSGDKLADAGIENIEDLTAYLPNVHFTETGFSTQVRVRGIGSDNSQGFEQSVGMYIDGIYYGRSQLFRTPMMDMARAELLRGPQSTLFGKNSVAGALNLTTAKPTDEFEAMISSSYEFEHEQTEINGVLSGPITDDFRARLAIRTYEENGYFDNTFKDLDEAYSEEEAVRLTLEWTPTEDLTLQLKGERNEFETKGRAIEITYDEPLVAGQRDYADVLDLLAQPEIDTELNYQRQTDVDESSDNQIDNFTFTANYELNDHTVTFVTGLLEYDYQEFCDCDFVAAEILELELNEEYEQFSQEIRITSPLGETFEWIAGVFYQDYDQTFTDDLGISDTNILPSLSASLAPLRDTGVSRAFEQTSEAYSVFGRVTWNISNQFQMIFGGRYTQEDKEASKVLSLFVPSTGESTSDLQAGLVYLGAFNLESEALASFDEQGNRIPDTGHNVSGDRSESSFDPLIIAQYQFNDDVMVYGSFTTGFKAGGFDPRSNSVGNFGPANANGNAPENLFFEFEDESTDAYELGVKSTLADGRGELNISLYRTDYEDLQISQFDGAVGFNVGNAKETRVQGIEIDGRWLIAEGLTASYGASWLDFEYLNFKNGNCYAGQTRDGLDLDNNGSIDTCDYTGKRGVYAPDYTLNMTLDYVTAITNDINFVGFIDVQQVDGHNVHVNLDPQGEIDAYTMLGARLGVETDNWSVAVLGKNLLDEEVLSYSANAPLSDTRFATNSHYSFVRRPRTVALEGVYKF